MSTTSCGNERHPAGAWHIATPLPFSWQYKRRVRGWLNRRRWGCRCEVGVRDDKEQPA